MGSLKNARSMGYVTHYVDHCFEISMTLDLLLTRAVAMHMMLSSVLKFGSVSSSQLPAAVISTVTSRGKTYSA